MNKTCACKNIKYYHQLVGVCMQKRSTNMGIVQKKQMAMFINFMLELSINVTDSVYTNIEIR